MRTALFGASIFLMATNLTPVIGLAQSASTEANLRTLIAQFDVGNDRWRARYANQLAQGVQKLDKTAQTAGTRALALSVVAKQAANDGRFDDARRQLAEIEALLPSLSSGDARHVGARIAIVKGQILLSERKHRDAFSTMLAARRAYGPMSEPVDIVWDEMLLWYKLSQENAPADARKNIDDIALTEAEETALAGPQGAPCEGTSLGTKRDRISGRQPIYPVISLNYGYQGAAVVRAQIAPDGKVTSARATAYAPREGFAAAAEIAMATWRYKIASDTPQACFSNVPTVFSFQIR